MNITKTALDSNRVTYLIISIIVFSGVFSYFQLSRDSMPPFTIRVCAIVSRFPGASPERVEKLVTEKIEEVVQEFPELENVTSESRTGLSVVSMELIPEITEEELQPIWDRLRRKIEDIQSELPENVVPEIQDDDVGRVYGIMLGLSGEGFSNSELRHFADDIRDDLIRLEDAAKVEISGIEEEQIFVEFDNARLAEIGLTPSQLQSIISSTNIVYSGGQVSLEDKRIVLEPTGNYESIEDLKKTLITVGQGSDQDMVELGNITNVRATYKSPPVQLVRIDGKAGLGISVSLKDGANLTRLGEVIDERIQYHQSRLPVGIELARIGSQDTYVNAKISEFVNNVIQSIVIVLAVMLLFLGFRTGMIVASLIPATMIMTLWLMSISDYGLNQVTLAALIMALGLLVDNAIVVSESILVKVEEGMSNREAAISAAQELVIPLLISSLTTSAAFLAFFLANNVMGEIVGPLFVVITMALLSSWILAMTLVTLLAVAFIRVNKKKAKQKSIFDVLNEGYNKLLIWTMKHPILFLVIIVVMFVGSLTIFPSIPFIFFPDSDRNLVTIDLNLPLGTKIEHTDEVVEEIETYLRDSLLVNASRPDGVTGWSAFIGEGPYSYDLGYQSGEANSGYAHFLINTTDDDQNQRVIDILNDFGYRKFPNAEMTVSTLANGGNSGADVEVRVSGDDPIVLNQLSAQIKRKLYDISGTQNIKDDWGLRIKKFIVDIDQDKARRAGVTNQDIAISLNTALSGYKAGAFRDDDNNIPIMMRQEGSLDLDARQLEGINIFSQNTGVNVPLVQVADINLAWQYPKILRRDLFRTISIKADAQASFTATDITDELSPWLQEAQQNWPDGYTYELGGESESSAEALGAVAEKLPISGFIILLLLILQFNSFRKTFIVLSTIPLGLIGVILGLFVFRSFFGFFAFLGTISLAGIIINNAIVLIDRIQIEQTENGFSPYRSIIEAARQRFRPILLTTFTTTLGLIPLYLGGGLMWEPLAIAIMIGLLFATVITLLFVPVLYKLLFNIKEEDEEGSNTSPLSNGKNGTLELG